MDLVRRWDSQLSSLSCLTKCWFEIFDINAEEKISATKSAFDKYRDFESCVEMNVEKGIYSKEYAIEEMKAMKGIKDCLLSIYLREVWVSEAEHEDLDPGMTVEVSLCIVEENERPSECSEQQWMKVKNLYDTHLFLQTVPASDFSLDVIKNVHERIAKGLGISSGYRKHQAAAAQTNVFYLSPNKIESRLASLIEFVNKKRSLCASLEDSLKVACIFFSEFLRIHPFADGNGRAARILIIHLLRNRCTVPFTLFLNENRNDYLTVLMESQSHNNMNALYTYILCCARNTAGIVDGLLE